MEGVSQVAVAATGCGPGKPCADLLYNVAVLLVIVDIRQFLVDNVLVYPVLPGTPRHFTYAARERLAGQPDMHTFQTAFIDDVGVIAPVMDISPGPLLDNVSFMPLNVVSIMQRNGMVVNDSKNKSGLVISLVGTGSRNAKRILDGVSRIPVSTCNLYVDTTYLHVGGTYEASGDLGPEAKNRCTGASRKVNTTSLSRLASRLPVRT